MSKDMKTQLFVEQGLVFLGEMVAQKLGDKNANPTTNSGAHFSNDVFELHAYCWCDQSLKGHENGCPNGFFIKKHNFSVNWYKYVGRSSEQNRMITSSEWSQIMVECLESLK